MPEQLRPWREVLDEPDPPRVPFSTLREAHAIAVECVALYPGDPYTVRDYWPGSLDAVSL